jgi:UDP-glucose 4-epimerase
MKKKVLITGVAGFIGSAVAKKFIREGFEVIGVDDLSSGHMRNVPNQIKFIKHDLSKKGLENKIDKKVKYILHLAGQSSGEVSFEDPITDLKKNTISTLNLIELSKNLKLQKFLYASSMSVYGDQVKQPVKEYYTLNPKSCYGIGKLASEKYLDLFKEITPYVNMRMFNVYGPGQDMVNLKQGMISIYLSQALNKKKIIVKGSIKRFRDFVYINDVVDIWFEATINKHKNLSLNIGTGKKSYVSTILKIIEKKCNVKYVVRENTLGDQHGIYANISNLKKFVKKIKFTDLKEGIEKFIIYEKNIRKKND